MQFGVFVTTKIDDWQVIKYAEELGFHSAWVPDSQMIWSDCYATLALAAHHTSRIRLGTGVAIPGTRIAPVTAHSIASINRLAPGRVFLGIGTGHSAMRLMGMAPMRVREFRDYLRVVRALLRGEEVEYTLNGVTRATRFLHQDLGFLNLQDPIPVYVAANGPLALQTAGELGDGLVSVFNEQPQVLQQNLRLVYAGAVKAGRALPPTFHLVTLTAAVVRQPGEKLTSERIIDEAGPWAAEALHFVYEIFQQTKQEDVIPAAFRGVWEEYCTHVEQMETPREKRYLQIHNGHGTFVVPEERRFITPEVIQGSCLVGEPQELIESLRRAEQAGLKEVGILPAFGHARKMLKEFAEQVMARF
jgi:alkanesulfonate monooxygenase SsuD/methylene tetrahydromethanopterin reductase-like flavin-dependent oxidoreductase (luciferase family)